MTRLLPPLRNAALSCAALALTLGTLELLLRAFPKALLPQGVYGAGAYSAELGMTVHSGRLIYNKVRFVERRANADGFMDVDHAHGKPPGTLRVGFFGDSYVESIQVPLDEVFFRRLPTQVAGRALEAFGFGKSGWGTVHELVVWRTFGPRYDLDVVCYVFVENDPGDSSFRLEQHRRRTWSPMPFADISNSPRGFDLHWLSPPGGRSVALRATKFVQERSLLAQLVETRLDLLRQRGLRVRADPNAVAMTERAGAVPDSNDAPSSWPKEYLDHVKELNARILAEWRHEVAARGGQFFVLYVPRGERQLTDEVALRETWRPWLGDVTRSLGIPLLDPSRELATRLATGDHVFDDHFSPAGHEVIATVVQRYLEALLQGEAGSPVGREAQVPRLGG